MKLSKNKKASEGAEKSAGYVIKWIILIALIVAVFVLLSGWANRIYAIGRAFLK